MNWKIGDVVVCINAKPKSNNQTAPPLRLNCEYVIQKIYTCIKCGDVSFDVGFGATSNTHCCSEIIPMKEIWWCDSKRFTKKKSLEEQREEALAKEDYETLEKLK